MKVHAVGSGPALHAIRSVSWIRALRFTPLLALPLAACTTGGEPADMHSHAELDTDHGRDARGREGGRLRGC